MRPHGMYSYRLETRLEEKNILTVSAILAGFRCFNFTCVVQTKFLYWAKLVDSVTRLQMPAGLVILVNQLLPNLLPLSEFCFPDTVFPRIVSAETILF